MIYISLGKKFTRNKTLVLMLSDSLPVGPRAQWYPFYWPSCSVVPSPLALVFSGTLPVARWPSCSVVPSPLALMLSGTLPIGPRAQWYPPRWPSCSVVPSPLALMLSGTLSMLENYYSPARLPRSQVPWNDDIV